MFYIYAIKSLASNRIYVGQSENVIKRLQQHNEGKVRSTSSDRPWILVARQSVGSREEARWTEYQLKQSRGKRERWLRRHAINDGLS